MLFFIDTANLAHIQEAYDMGILDGVTTNPSLMHKEGIGGAKAIMEHYRKICDIVPGDVSAEVTALDATEMVRQGKIFASIAENIVVKIPMTLDGVKAISELTREGIRTNCTLIFSSGQALIAAKAGATYVSPFIGRIDDISWDGMSLISEINEMFGQQAFDCMILAASIRSPKHIVDAALAGADVVTAPLDPIKKLVNHPLTDVGLAQFMKDHEASEAASAFVAANGKSSSKSDAKAEAKSSSDKGAKKKSKG